MELFKIFGKIAIDNTEANKELEETSGKASDSAGKMTGAFKKIGAAVATYLTVDAIKNFGLGCITAAADAQAMASQFSQVFGDLEGQASKSLSNIANEAGISENRMKGSFTKIAAFAKTTGMDTESSLALSERAMIAVADSAAFYDRSLEETTESLQSFLKGNFENDAALGLSCTEVTRNAAANKLYGKSFKDLSESQKQLTLLQMVEDANKASGALGQAARESDTWTNVTGNLKQTWKDFQAALGTNVLDNAVGVVKMMVSAVEKCTEKIPEAVEWFGELKTKAEDLGVFSWLSDKIAAVRDGFEKVADFAKRLWDNLEPLVTLIRDNLVYSLEQARIYLGPLKNALADLQPVIELVAGVLGGALATAIGIAVGAINGIVSAIDGFVLVIQGIVEIVSGCFQLIVGIFTGNADLCVSAMEEIWDGVCTVFGGLWDAVSGFVEGFVDGVVGFFEGLWDTLVGHSIVPDTIDGITDCFSGLWDGVSGFVSDFCGNVTEKFTKLKDSAVEKFGELKDKAVEKFGQLKESAGEKWESLKSTVSEKASTLKDKATTAFSTLKDKATSAFSELKAKVTGDAGTAESTAGSKFSSLQSKVANSVNQARDAAKTAFSAIKDSISSGVSGAATSVSDKFGSILSKVKDVMTQCHDFVSSGISRIAKLFSSANWSLPKIKLPHFNISGSFSLNPPSVPKFSVEWYKKAMNNPMIMNSPTIFGYNPATGQYRGGGEAGSEVVSGTNTLMNMIGEVVEEKTAGQNDRIIEILIAILHAITGGNEELLRALLAGQTIKLNEREFGRAVREYA